MTEDDGTPAASAPSNHLEQRDFKVQLFGDVAATSFTDHSTALFHGLSSRKDGHDVTLTRSRTVL